MNSGDWVESMTALVEDFEGRWSLVYFQSEKQITEQPSHELADDFSETNELII